MSNVFAQEQVIREILEKMREKKITLDNLYFNGGYRLIVNELRIEFTDSGDQATIFYNGKSKRVFFLEELAKEVVTLLLKDSSIK